MEVVYSDLETSVSEQVTQLSHFKEEVQHSTVNVTSTMLTFFIQDEAPPATVELTSLEEYKSPIVVTTTETIQLSGITDLDESSNDQTEVHHHGFLNQSTQLIHTMAQLDNMDLDKTSPWQATPHFDAYFKTSSVEMFSTMLSIDIEKGMMAVTTPESVAMMINDEKNKTPIKVTQNIELAHVPAEPTNIGTKGSDLEKPAEEQAAASILLKDDMQISTAMVTSTMLTFFIHDEEAPETAAFTTVEKYKSPIVVTKTLSIEMCEATDLSAPLSDQAEPYQHYFPNQYDAQAPVNLKALRLYQNDSVEYAESSSGESSDSSLYENFNYPELFRWKEVCTITERQYNILSAIYFDVDCTKLKKLEKECFKYGKNIKEYLRAVDEIDDPSLEDRLEHFLLIVRQNEIGKFYRYDIFEIDRYIELKEFERFRLWKPQCFFKVLDDDQPLCWFLEELYEETKGNVSGFLHSTSCEDCEGRCLSVGRFRFNCLAKTDFFLAFYYNERTAIQSGFLNEPNRLEDLDYLRELSVQLDNDGFFQFKVKPDDLARAREFVEARRSFFRTEPGFSSYQAWNFYSELSVKLDDVDVVNLLKFMSHLPKLLMHYVEWVYIFYLKNTEDLYEFNDDEDSGDDYPYLFDSSEEEDDFSESDEESEDDDDEEEDEEEDFIEEEDENLVQHRVESHHEWEQGLKQKQLRGR